MGQMWMRKTCIRFVQAGSAEARSTGHSHYITIFSGQGCYSSVGYNHRSHQVSLQAGGCTYAGIVAHELGHTIGLHHEQCRPDRDNYLNIFLSNVPSKMRFNFNKVSGLPTLACPTTTALSCTMEPRLLAAVNSPSCPRIWTTSLSLGALMSEAPTSPTPTPPLSTRCTGAPTLWLRLPAPRFPAPADGLPRLATLSAVKPRSQERTTMWRSMESVESVEVVKRARSWVVLLVLSHVIS